MATITNPFDALDEYRDTSDLTKTTAESNILAAPQLEELSKLVNQINQAASLARAPEAGVSSQLWQNLGQNAAGNLSGSFINNLQSNLAQDWGSRGFGVDTNAMNAAAQRAMGLESQDLQSQAVKDYATMMGTLPDTWDVSSALMTPALSQASRQSQIENALKAYALQDETNRWKQQLAQQNAQFGQSLAARGSGVSLGSDFGKTSTGSGTSGTNYDWLASQLFGGMGAGAYSGELDAGFAPAYSDWSVVNDTGSSNWTTDDWNNYFIPETSSDWSVVNDTGSNDWTMQDWGDYFYPGE